MATDYQAIMLALARGDSWARITEDAGCSRRTIDKASRAMKMHGLSTVNDVEALSRTVLAGMLPRAVSWYWVCVDVVLGGCALLVLAPASVRQGPGVG